MPEAMKLAAPASREVDKSPGNTQSQPLFPKGVSRSRDRVIMQSVAAISIGVVFATPPVVSILASTALSINRNITKAPAAVNSGREDPRSDDI